MFKSSEKRQVLNEFNVVAGVGKGHGQQEGAAAPAKSFPTKAGEKQQILNEFNLVADAKGGKGKLGGVVNTENSLEADGQKFAGLPSKDQSKPGADLHKKALKGPDGP
jgi:hypothetical protein